MSESDECGVIKLIFAQFHSITTVSLIELETKVHEDFTSMENLRLKLY